MLPYHVSQLRRLYRETHMKYNISSQENPDNSPIYFFHSDLDSFILYNNENINEQVVVNEKLVEKEEEKKEKLDLVEHENHKSKPKPIWSMSFDGSCGKNRSGVGVWVHNTNNNHTEGHSYKLNFQCTNNIAEYEALLLGLQLLKKLEAKRISVHRDSELVIRKIKGEYSSKHPRLRAYRNATLDLLKTFKGYDLSSIPRNQNIISNGLAFAASTFQLPHSNKQYTVQVRFRPKIPDNIRY